MSLVPAAAAAAPAPGAALGAPGGAFHYRAVTLPGGKIQITLPTGQPACRQFMQSICINVRNLLLLFIANTDLIKDDEAHVGALPSHDVVVELPAGTDMRLWIAKLVRREGYFRALLVQSRGRLVGTPCRHRCGGNTGPSPFTECRRLAGFQGGACGSCVWQSHGARCDLRG